MELQDRQSYFRQASAGMIGFGIGMLIVIADYSMNGVINAATMCAGGGAAVTSLGLIGWLFTRSLIK